VRCRSRLDRLGMGGHSSDCRGTETDQGEHDEGTPGHDAPTPGVAAWGTDPAPGIPPDFLLHYAPVSLLPPVVLVHRVLEPDETVGLNHTLAPRLSWG
jgi:hypothetical protein